MQNFDEIIKTIEQTIKQSAESSQIVGKPIALCDGSVVLPISKISVGFVGGSTDIENAKKIKAPTGIGGGGVSVTPMGFFICGAQKRYIPIDGSADNKWLDFARSTLNLFKKEE